MRPQTRSFLYISTTLLALLGCGLVSVATNPAPVAGVPYWTAQTATPVATVTVFLGTTTPVYPPTPVPGVLTLPPQVITTVPEWTTATATSEPPWLPPTTTPFGFTATPLWITTTRAGDDDTRIYHRDARASLDDDAFATAHRAQHTRADRDALLPGRNLLYE